MTDEEKKMSNAELAEKIGKSRWGAQKIKKTGSYVIENDNYISKEQLAKKYFQEVGHISAESILELLSSPTVQDQIVGYINESKKILRDYNENTQKIERGSSRGSYLHKRFQTDNGEILSVGDLIAINFFNENQIYRDTDGCLYSGKDNDKKTVVLGEWFSEYSGLKPVITVSVNDDEEITLRSFGSFLYWKKLCPTLVKKGIIQEIDFPIVRNRTKTFEVIGAHERKITKKKPYVYFSNDETSAMYYIGRNKFTGTEREINHENTSIILLDKNTAGIVEMIHGKKQILYTFPLISQEE